MGDELVNQGHFGADRIRNRIDEIVDMWNRLKARAEKRRQQLEQAIGYHQFFTDADDTDTWMLDTLRLVSSDDVGNDEGSVQNLLKKHKEVDDDMKNYCETIEQLHAQAQEIGPEYRESPDVKERTESIEKR